eukprot:4683387-Amphidinium_carterae.1
MSCHMLHVLGALCQALSSGLEPTPSPTRALPRSVLRSLHDSSNVHQQLRSPREDQLNCALCFLPRTSAIDLTRTWLQHDKSRSAPSPVWTLSRSQTGTREGSAMLQMVKPTKNSVSLFCSFVKLGGCQNGRIQGCL